MIIQIGTEVDESRILWKHKESDEWERADIDDLIHAYENRPKGEWVRTKNPIGETIVVCSNCGKIRQQGYDNFCGACGADMRPKDGEGE